jgi:hypothetical protein
MAMPTSGAVPVAGSEPRTRTALLLEGIALRHQIAVLERSGTRRPCFRLWDRLFWILFSRWWPQWRDSLIIVQPETVLRWRRNGWSALWRYRARVRWRGGRPRVSSEVRQLIAQMACVWRIADSGEISNSPHTPQRTIQNYRLFGAFAVFSSHRLWLRAERGTKTGHRRTHAFQQRHQLATHIPAAA